MRRLIRHMRHVVSGAPMSARPRIRPGVLALALVLAAALLLALPARALADIVFTGNGQTAFGVDANGTSVDGQGTDQFTEALDKFRHTEEG